MGDMLQDSSCSYGNIGWKSPRRIRMTGQDQFLEQIWDGILSREDIRIRRAFLSLDAISQKIVREHLVKMTGEEGWHPEQQKSAIAALKVIREINRE